MGIKNSSIIDYDNQTYSVLDTIAVQLFPGYLWHTSDINEKTSVGACFDAYEDPPVYSVASIAIVDVTADPNEPDASVISSQDVAGIDALLKSAISQQFEIKRWMSTVLNEGSQGNALVTAYIAHNDDKDWQYYAARMKRNSRKYVIVGMFEVAKAEPLAQLIFRSLNSHRFKALSSD